jgi:hypothetical protein
MKPLDLEDFCQRPEELRIELERRRKSGTLPQSRKELAYLLGVDLRPWEFVKLRAKIDTAQQLDKAVMSLVDGAVQRAQAMALLLNPSS